MTGIAPSSAGRVIVAGLCASVALAAALALTGAASGPESLLAGLVAATATLVVDGTLRAERRFRQRSPLEAADWLHSAVLSLAASTRQIVDEHAEPEILVEARRGLLRLTEQFDELAHGRITRAGTDYELLFGGTNACHRRLQEVTTIPAGGSGPLWWDSDTGRRYWQANLKALGRGVAITRVFVCDRVDAELAELIAEQSQAGVQTLVAPGCRVEAAPWDRVGAGPHDQLRALGRGAEDLSSCLDFVVWDGRRAFRALTNARADVIETVFTVNEQDLRQLTAAFAACAEDARTVAD